jgi:cytochrome c biogenesis protein CcmG/thiol:disulfide interchange protein DsbE
MTTRLTRRALLGRALGVGGVALGLGTLGACASSPAAVEIDPNAHPLDGLMTFDGVPLEAPAMFGRVTLLDFWASWCAPCRQAFRYLDQLYRTYAADGLFVLGVGVDEDPREGRGFLARTRPRFETAWDGKGKVAARFGVASLPTTVLLDRDGTIVYRHQGFDVGSHRVLEAHVRRLVDAI